MGELPTEPAALPAALFVLSTRDDDALANVAIDAGWTVVAGDGDHDVTADYLASGAAVALVDARGSLAAGLAATEALGGLVAANGGALVVQVARGDVGALCDFHEAGATHVLASPASDGEVAQAIRSAARHAARTAEGWTPDTERRAMPRSGDGAIAEARHWIAARLGRGVPIGVVFVALSRLDLVNAAHGRPGADALIGAVTQVIGAIAGAQFGDRVFTVRISGSEFLIAAEADAAAMLVATERLSAALAEPLAGAGGTGTIGSRLGMTAARPGDDAATLLRRAGEALVAAKGSGGATLQIAGTDGPAPLDALAVDLHHAIERGDIDILFQPQGEVAGGRVTGVEALARWEHASLGPLGADALFAAAERADLGIALSDHIQQLVLARASAWPVAFAGLRLSLNLTAGDIARPGFAALFLGRVAASGFALDRLTVEVTETGAIVDLAAAAALLDELRGAGCRIAIDDFGTGYSSLAYLTALPLDYLKLDKALTVGIDRSARERIVVGGIIDMARNLDLAIVAEGVESEAQRTWLEDRGCGFYQGFLLAPPLDEAGLLALLEGR